MSSRNVITGTVLLMAFILIAGITIINMHDDTHAARWRLIMRDASGVVMVDQSADRCYVSANGGAATLMGWDHILLEVGKPLNGSVVCERLP